MNRKLLFLTTTLISGFTFTAANAGFEWNPPPARAVATSNAQPESLTSSSGSGPLTPMIGESVRVEPVMSADIMDGAAPLPPVTQTNVAGMKSIGAENDLMLPVPGDASYGSNNTSGAKTVEGFGKDIPLATALTQIVPPGYAIAYDGGVDQGKPVSWKGGKAWNVVLSDMLSAKKMHAQMSGGNTIRIVKGSGPALNAPAQTQTAQASSSDAYDPIIFNDAPVAKSGRPVIDMSLQKKWTAPAGQSLRDTLSNWSSQASVELAWQSMGDMKLKSNFAYDGTYDQAVDALLSLYSGEKNEPHGKLYPNLPEGPSVLVISSN